MTTYSNKRALQFFAVATAMYSLSACNNITTPDENLISSFQTQSLNFVEKNIIINNLRDFKVPYTVNGTLLKKLVIEVDVDKGYGSLSLYADDELLIDNIDVPKAGKQTLNALVNFNKLGQQTLRFSGRSNNITISAVHFEDVNELVLPNFKDVSKAIGLVTEETYKYGGPSIGDIDNDGDYDFALNNHNHIPTQLVTNQGNGKVSIKRLFPSPQDFHGSSFGDYDNDGDLDLMVALGGANGTSPTSYALFNNDNGNYINVSAKAGIATPARGRAPRWIDLDLDGKLDLALFNAKTPNYDGPQQIFYHNNGDGTFKKINIKGVEDSAGERVLITDFNHDGKDDFVVFSPVSLWQNNGDLTFTDVSEKWLPNAIKGKSAVITATDVDVNNDGLLDLYFARGKTHYLLSKKSIDFNPNKKKLDIRDDGEKGTTAISFQSDGAIKLSDMELTYRQYNGGYAIFLGKDKQRKIVKAKGFQVSQLPAEMKYADDYLDIDVDDALGWPEERKENGLYIGYLGNGQWQAEWVRTQNVYWTVTFSLTGLNDVNYDWQANNRNESDVLIINQGDHFVDGSAQWNIPTGGDHWGVTHGDLNNDGHEDMFVYRYGFLRERIADLVLLNNGKGAFEQFTAHGAKDINDPGHGDMGQAFDFDLDGKIDLLNGSEEEGHWYLYQNDTKELGNYALVHVDYSPKDNIDPVSAVVTLTTGSGKRYLKRVGSTGESFSQSLINIVHFGLGSEEIIKSIDIKWRNGEVQKIKDVPVNKLYKTH
ncbi:CRTAC1 family protein [Thalassotalea sp. PLHSN55]|uniref:CRTAC1 family protein n=1 Tax=Thalassotalea sp. PLHSN55 TaxID=3435888 RepID=UPI003F838118